jgi:hypothetical protein
MNKTSMLLIALALSLPRLTDWLVDTWPPEATGYSEAERTAMDRLVDQVVCDDWLCQLSERAKVKGIVK